MEYADYGLYVLVLLWLLGTHFKEGLWGNCLLALNAIFASLFAQGIGQALLKIEAVNKIATDTSGVYLRVLVQFALYAVPLWIFLVLGIMLTNKLSKSKSRFPAALDNAGAVVFAVITLESLLRPGLIAMLIHRITTVPG
jgi:hypothetical protein